MKATYISLIPFFILQHHFINSTSIPKLPQKHIASYIGVTPEYFSKMKSRANRKNRPLENK